MRLGRGHYEQPDPNEELLLSRLEPSEKGRAKIAFELGIWLPCPRVFPPKHDAESWSTSASILWWERSGLPHNDYSVDQLAAVFRSVREISYARVRSHQLWIYLRDPAAQPLPVDVRVLKQRGGRDRRLRLLAGADDADSVRKPKVAKVATSHLGTGLRAERYRTQDDNGSLLCILSYAFRVEEHETDLQVFTASTDLRALTAARDDIDRFVQSITVHAKTGG
jgi:hypothetical protein